MTSFTSSSRQTAVQRVREGKAVRAEPRMYRSKRAWFMFFSRAMTASVASRLPFHSSLNSFCPSWERM